MKVCVIGLGEVGLPTAKYAQEKGLEVVGHDIKQEAVDRAKKQGIKASTNWKETPPADAYIICVYAGLKDSKPDFSSIFDACRKIWEKNQTASPRETCLVSIESTLMPGLCRKVYQDIFKKSVRLVHVPHRFWAGDPVRHGVKQLRIIGAIDNDSLKEGSHFYKKILSVPLHKVSTIEIAEMSKVTEQTFRYVQIAFAEELKMMCSELGMDYDELRDACNTKWNIEMPEARDGIGGHCLPKDSKYFASLTKRAELVNSAMLVDEHYKTQITKKAAK